MAKNITGQGRKPVTNSQCTAKRRCVYGDRLAQPRVRLAGWTRETALSDVNEALQAIEVPAKSVILHPLAEGRCHSEPGGEESGGRGLRPRCFVPQHDTLVVSEH